MLLLALLLVTIQSGLIYLNQTACPGYLQTFKYTEIQSEMNFLVGVQVISTKECLYYQPLSGQKYRYCYYQPELFSQFPQMRTAPKQVGNSGNFLTFYSSKVVVHSNLTNQTLKYLNFSSFFRPKIFDTCFGSNPSQIYVLAQIKDGVQILIFNNSINYSVRKSLKIPSCLFDKLVCKNNYLVILFECAIQIYSLNQSLIWLKQITIPETRKFILDMQVNNQILVIGFQQYVRLYNITQGFTLKSQIIMSQNISGVDIIEPYYVVVSTSSSLYQFDYQINLFQVSKVSYSFSSFTYRPFRVGNNTVVISRDYMLSPFRYSFIYYFQINPFYLSTGNCPPTYTFMPTTMQCYKSSLIPPQLINQTDLVNSTTSSMNTSIIYMPPTDILLNESFPITYSNILANNSRSLPNEISNNTYNFSKEKVIEETEKQQESEEQLISYFGKMMEEQNYQVLKAISTVFIISSFKFTPQFLLLMVNIVDDLSYYKFHQKQYPITVQYFMANIDIIQSQKLSPQFMDAFNTIKSKTLVAIQQNYLMVIYFNIYTLINEDVYFIRSFVENYRFPTIISFFVFMTIKILAIISSSIKKKYKCFVKIFKILNRNSSIWIFISSIIQPVFSRVAFDFGNQIIYSNSYFFVSKLNLLMCLLLHFKIIIYMISFYPLLYQFKKKYSKLISIPSKRNSFSYLLISAFMLSRIFIRSMVHALALSNYKIQMLCLMLVDFVIIVECIKLRNNFYNKVIFTCYLVLIITFFSFDLYFFLEETGSLPVNHKRQLFGLITIIVMILSSICASLVLFFCSLKGIIAKIKKKIEQLKISNTKIMDRQKARETITIQKKRKTTVLQTKPTKTVKMTVTFKSHINQAKKAQMVPKLTKNLVNSSTTIKRKQNDKIKKVKCTRTNIKMVFESK